MGTATIRLQSLLRKKEERFAFSSTWSQIFFLTACRDARVHLFPASLHSVPEIPSDRMKNKAVYFSSPARYFCRMLRVNKNIPTLSQHTKKSKEGCSF